MHHPAALLDKPIERVVIDPANPYVLGPQLLCAATELPIDDAEVRCGSADDGGGRRWSTTVCCGGAPDATIRRPVSTRTRPSTSAARPAATSAIVETETGRLLGGVGAGQAPASVHPGAVYLHQGETYVVDSLDFADAIAFVHADDPGLRHLRPRTHRHHGDRIAVNAPISVTSRWAWSR